MFISRRTHDAIVASLQAQILALTADRDFYRGLVFGASPTSPATSPATFLVSPATSPVIGALSPGLRSASPQATADEFSTWTVDDWRLFDNWCVDQPEFRQGVSMRALWRERFGEQSPLMVLSV